MPLVNVIIFLFKVKRFMLYLVIILILFEMRFMLKKKSKNDLAPLFYFNDINIDNNVLEFEQLGYNMKLINFENFNNNSGLGPLEDYIVPNIVHYVHLNQVEIKFPLFLSILSVWLNQKPELIIFHCNECKYQGKYWEEINRIKELRSIIKIKEIVRFDSNIFTKTAGWIHHKSDVIRLLVLMKYGGIYLDNDMLLLKSFNKYRKFEMVTSWDSDADGIGNQVFIANKNARLLRAMYDGYRKNYNASQWYYNGGYYPAKILLSHRYLAHSVKLKLGSHNLIHELYFEKKVDFQSLDSIHLLINHRSYLDAKSPIKEFDEKNIQNYEFAFGEIARDLLKRSNAFSN